MEKVFFLIYDFKNLVKGYLYKREKQKKTITILEARNS